MKLKLFGRTGVAVPVIGQGTWDIPERGEGRARAIAALRRGIELGMTHVDTAEMYGAGIVEEIVGDAIAGIARERLFIASKVLPSNASFEGTLAACEASLRRLRLEYLDLYMLHWPSEYPVEETMRALERLVHDGKTRFIGVSNFEPEEMQEAMRYLDEVPLACNQVLYHVRERGVERRLIRTARDAQVAVVAYTPFGRGSFPSAACAPGGVLDRVARKHGATPRAVILAFLTREPNVFTIPKASGIAHVEENVRAGDLQLDAEDVAAIDAALPEGPDGPLAML